MHRHLRRCLLALALVAGLAVPVNAVASSATSPVTLLAAINQVRAQHGLAAVAANDDLARAARAHTDDMLKRNYFLHESGPGGMPFYKRILRFWQPTNKGALGEVLAWGTGPFGGASSSVTRWMNSPEHRAILMSSSFTEIGIGVSSGQFQGHSGAVVWTADFARP